MANAGEGKRVESASVYSRPEIHRESSFLVVIRVWREREWVWRSQGEENSRNGDGRRWTPVRILRSACVSQYPSRPKLDFRNSRWRASDHAVHLGLLAPRFRPNFPRFRRERGHDRPTKTKHTTLCIRGTRAARSPCFNLFRRERALWINKLGERGRDDRDDLFSSLLIWPFPVLSYATQARIKVRIEPRDPECVAHQKLKNTSVKVSAHVNSANTIQYIIHFTWKRKDCYTVDLSFYDDVTFRELSGGGASTMEENFYYVLLLE